MNKDTKIVPELRFPEFQSEWNSHLLGDVSKLITEKAGTKNYKLLSVTAGVGLVSQMEKFGREIAGESYKNYYVIQKGDFAYNKSSVKVHPEGQIALLENEESGAVPNSIFTCFRVDKEVVLPAYLKYPFENNIHGIWLRNYIAIGARANGALNVDNKFLLSLPIPIPTIPEQQKIASCLSSLDELINAHTQKLDALKDHKKGLMQQLFPVEGETVPKIRFKEFEKDGEWKSNFISEFAKVTTGSKNTENKVIEGLYPFFVRSQNIEQINTFAYDGEAVLTSGDGVGVGKNFHYINGKFDFHQRVYCIFEFSDKVSGKFFYHYFSEHFNKRVMQLSAKNSVDSVRQSMITEMPVCLPSKDEQQKIANFLSSIDDEITAQAQKLEALKEHKKGLMQGLFPVINE
jgi:type I restriction enzyme S subunit